MTLIKIHRNLLLSLHVGNGVESDVYTQIVNLTGHIYEEDGVSILNSRIRCTQGKYYFRDSAEAMECYLEIIRKCTVD